MNIYNKYNINLYHKVNKNIKINCINMDYGEEK